MYILRIFTVNLTKSFMIHEINGCPWHWKKYTSSLYQLPTTSWTYPPEGKEASVLIQKCFLWTGTSTYLKFKDKIFKACVRY